MQSMNTDPSQYYNNPTGAYPNAGGYHLPNGIETQYTMRNPNQYPQQHISPGFYNPAMNSGYGTQAIYYTPPYAPSAQFGQGQRGSSSQYIPLVRPSNETSPGGQTFIQHGGYSPYPSNNLSQQSNSYNPPYYAAYQPPMYSTQNISQQTSSSQISNQSQIAQPPYSVANNNQPVSQSTQQPPFDQQHIPASQSTQLQDKKREKKPILIIDPESNKAVEVGTTPVANGASISTTTATNDNRPKEPVTDSIISDTNSLDAAKKVQKQAAFRQQFAELLHSKAPTDKSGNQSSVDDQTDSSSTKTKQTDNVVSSSRTKSPVPVAALTKISEQPHPGPPGIRTRSMTEEKAVQNEKEARIDSQKQNETVDINSESTSDKTINPINDDDTSSPVDISESEAQPTLSSATSVERVTPPATPSPSNGSASESTSIEKTSLIPKRLSYTKEQLLNRRSDPLARKRPTGLKNIEGVTEAPIPRQMSMGHDSGIRRPQNISIDKPPPFRNLSENPYKPADPNKVDVNQKFLREVTAILNKVTPQTYDKLLVKLDELELDRYERLDGMITIIFSKAVDEKSFCSLYATLCKHFQKKQVTVPSEDGKAVTHYFRQILLTRCQTEFQSDYRLNIDYEKRKEVAEAITDEKVRKEELEKLEEDLGKAKRKKLGNIFFIGELFKLQMLTAPIMYDCIEYLLRDKTDEEALECLCRLLRTIGKELDTKAGDKTPTRAALEKHYAEMVNITKAPQTTSRIRFMIQDLLEQRKADWVARRVEAQPTTIDAIHEAERIKREQQERDQERERLQRRDQHRGGHPQQYAQSHGSRGSGVKQPSNRPDEERNENRFSVNQVRQLQSNDKRNQGSVSLSFAPPRAWNKGSGVDKKPEDDRSNAARTGKPPAGPVQQLKAKTNSSPGTPGYPIQRQSSRELARETSQRDRENAMDSLRKTTNNVWATNSREGSRNVSREPSRNASPDSSVNERVSNANSTTEDNKTTANNAKQSSTSFNEEKTQARVHSLIEEYTENYSDNNKRPVKEAIEDLNDFCTANTEEQAIVVRELFTNVLEAKPRARKAVGHLLGVALDNNILSKEGFSRGFQMIVEAAPDYAVDIPLIWQYIGEVTGAFVGAFSANMLLLKSILQSIPAERSKQFFQYIIRYAVEFSSKSHLQKFWQSSGFSFADLLQSNLLDSPFMNEYAWLSEATEAETTSLPVKENLGPRPDSQLVKLFKAVNDQGVVVSDDEIIEYIKKNMTSTDKYYIRNIVLSYLEACLISRGTQKKIQEDIAKTRMSILNIIIDHKTAAEVQAVYAIQNFVHKLEHPQKMARLLFDIFYDEECVTEDSFFEWRRHPDQSENEGHSVVEISTNDFFTWLQQAESEGEEEES